MGKLQALAFAEKENGVLANHVASAQGLEADLFRWSLSHLTLPGESEVGRALAGRGCDVFR